MTVQSPHLLLIEDDPSIRRFLRNTLTVHGFQLTEATTGAEGLKLVRERIPQIVVIDLSLPDADGLDLIPEIRRLSPVPIIILSSRGDEKTKVSALDLGADDYVTKPFGVDEFMARIRAAIRHSLTAAGGAPIVRTGNLQIDLIHRRVSLSGIEVKLSPKEFELLKELAVHAGKVLTHRHLLRAGWTDTADVDIQYLRIYIRQLRQKLESAPDQPRYILTEPGVGYRLAPGES